ncbi:aminopeptidase P family protein [Vampirovibrio sp.]|uniref:aminopeptidase P family protein n=1 Tax=Vampirovibrio sp. TaxID=2717857 RepID=UPI003594823F
MTAVSNSQAQKAATGQKLQALREAMALHQLDAYLIPSADEHINEYLPENKQRRAWISGFTGSAGDCLIGTSEAWVFADSRYYEQVETEVDAAHIHISKLGLEGHPSVTEAIKQMAENLEPFRLGFDPFTLSVQQFQGFQKALKETAVTLVPVTGNLIDPLWQDAPAATLSEVFALPDSVSGQSSAEKIAAVQAKLKTLKADFLPVTKLDQIAWLFNWRGQDIPYNPVFTAYALIAQNNAYLFMEASRIQPAALQALSNQVEIQPYEQYAAILKTLAAEQTALIDPKHTTCGTFTLIQAHNGQIKEAEHPIERMKAIKNPLEIAGMKAANLKASRGKIRAWAWLDQQISTGKPVTEESFKNAIEAFYAEEDGFFGLSFNTISGAGANASIVHYGTPNPHKTLEAGELFLIDSGCQFIGGTTDDTRTLLIGQQATPTQQLRYTAVLQAHINCAMQRFPKGTDGIRLDGITRAALWQHGLDYGHGTGHGVGAFLNVHEGPNGIHKMAHQPLEPGMITSVEPGFYEPGWGGIRLENLYLTVDRTTDTDTDWYGFESLTYIPFDQKLIDWQALSRPQLDWLSEYYQQILNQIGPTLSGEEAAWLQAACQIPKAANASN